MRIVLSAVLLAACTDASEAWPPQPGESQLHDASPAAQHVLPPPGVDLVLEVSDVIPGQQATLTAYDADPGETVFFVRSTAGLGSPGVCPGALGGNCLDLNGPVTVAGNAVANGQGVATFSFNVPAGAPNGLTAWFEAAAPRGGVASVTSNAVERVLGQSAAYEHTITIDGDGTDWRAEEAFDTTSGIGQTWVSWDATRLYLGLQHPDIATGGGEHWSVVYLGTAAPGTTSGITHNTQTPDLPFRASHAIRRKADGSFDSLLAWDGMVWQETADWLGTQGSAAAEGGDLLELAIPRQLLGGARVQIATAFVFEGSGFESTFAGTPADSFVDGYDPDLGSFYEFDLNASDSPTAQNP
jgi:hypothetical protein